MKNNITTEERFWTKVNKTNNVNDCWEWTAAIGADGYGVFHWKYIEPKDRAPSGCRSKLIKAHRASLYLDGRTVPEGLVILHSCDNKSCVNPNHLSVNTQKQNVRDYYSKRYNKDAKKQQYA